MDHDRDILYMPDGQPLIGTSTPIADFPPAVFVGNPLTAIAATLNRIEKNLRDIQDALARLAQP